MDTELISEDELDYRLHRCDPVNRAAIGSESFTAAVASMQRTIESRAPRPAAPLGRRPAQRRRWAVLGAATAAVAVASLVGVETLTGGSGGAGLPLAVPPVAAAQLNEVAHAALGQAGLSAGQWLYVESSSHFTGWQSAGGTTVTYSVNQVHQDWLGGDGDLRTRATNSDFTFATPQDQAAYEADRGAFPVVQSEATDGVITDGVSRKQSPQEPWEASPPNDPQSLISEVASYSASALGKNDPTTASGQLDPSLLWRDLSLILTTSASAQLRSTAYAALAYVPGMRVLGNRTDQLGRSGVAISFTGSSPEDEIETLIVDPSTGDLLEADEALQIAEGSLSAGTVTSRETFGRPVVVDSDMSLPGGGSLPIDTNAPIK